MQWRKQHKPELFTKKFTKMFHKWCAYTNLQMVIAFEIILKLLCAYAKQDKILSRFYMVILKLLNQNAMIFTSWNGYVLIFLPYESKRPVTFQHDNKCKYLFMLPKNPTKKCLTHLLLKPQNFILIWSILWLLMPWLLVSPGQQQPWYWLHRIKGSFPYMRKDSIYLCHLSVEK